MMVLTPSHYGALAHENTQLEPGVFQLRDVELAIEYAKNARQFRKVRNRQGGPTKVIHSSFKTRNHPSFQNDHAKILEGRLEGDYCLLLEFDHEVESYSCQPFKLLGTHSSGFFSFVPDHVVYPFNAPPYIVDCKPKVVLGANKHKERHELLKKALKMYGVDLVAMTDNVVQEQPRLNVYKFLYQRLSLPQKELKESLVDVLTELHKSAGTATSKDLRHLGEARVRQAVAYGLHIPAQAEH